MSTQAVKTFAFIKRLQPFQQQGSDFLVNHPHALLADEPGLGKTVQALHAAARLGLKNVLVVCPASVREGWKREARECGIDFRIVVISYEQAVKFVAQALIVLRDYDGLILDEAHYLKTSDSKRTQALFGPHGVARWQGLRVRWALTGTPVLNRPRELWPILKCLDPQFWELTWDRYAQRYCGAFHNGREIDTRGATNIPELSQKLLGFMLRRTKEQVMEQLPAKIITRVAVELQNGEKEEIFAAENEILDREARISTAAEGTSSLGDLAKMLHATGRAKVRAVADFVGELLETEEKVVVFYKHTEVVQNLFRLLEEKNYGCVVYKGGMNDADKTHLMHVFQNENGVRVFFGQIDAAGTGINGLQDVCSTVVFAELDWTPGKMQQAIDRLHRIGQKAKTVTAYILHAPGTMESAVLAVQNAKGSVVGRLMGETGWRA